VPQFNHQLRSKIKIKSIINSTLWEPIKTQTNRMQATLTLTHSEDLSLKLISLNSNNSQNKMRRRRDSSLIHMEELHFSIINSNSSKVLCLSNEPKILSQLTLAKDSARTKTWAETIINSSSSNRTSRINNNLVNSVQTSFNSILN